MCATNFKKKFFFFLKNTRNIFNDNFYEKFGITSLIGKCRNCGTLLWCKCHLELKLKLMNDKENPIYEM